jgi:hypothetical protein
VTAYQAYRTKLVALHRLIREGVDEGPLGEALRDEMDGLASRMTDEEIVAANEFSAELAAEYVE